MATNMGAVVRIQAVLEAEVSFIPVAITQKWRNTMADATISFPQFALGKMRRPFILIIRKSVIVARKRRAVIISTGSSWVSTTLIEMYDTPQKTTGMRR